MFSGWVAVGWSGRPLKDDKHGVCGRCSWAASWRGPLPGRARLPRGGSPAAVPRHQAGHRGVQRPLPRLQPVGVPVIQREVAAPVLQHDARALGHHPASEDAVEALDQAHPAPGPVGGAEAAWYRPPSTSPDGTGVGRAQAAASPHPPRYAHRALPLDSNIYINYRHGMFINNMPSNFLT